MTSRVTILAGSLALLASTALSPAFAKDISFIYCGDTINPVHKKAFDAWTAKNPDSKVAGKWGVTTLPVGGENTEARASLVAGFTWVVAANTEKTDLAKAFIEYAASSEVNSELIVADPQTGIDPNRESSLESATNQSVTAGPSAPAIRRNTESFDFARSFLSASSSPSIALMRSSRESISRSSACSVASSALTSRSSDSARRPARARSTD